MIGPGLENQPSDSLGGGPSGSTWGGAVRGLEPEAKTRTTQTSVGRTRRRLEFLPVLWMSSAFLKTGDTGEANTSWTGSEVGGEVLPARKKSYLR